MAFNLCKQVSVSYSEIKEPASHITDCEISDFKMSVHLQRLRKKPRISYYEPEEPDFDEYVYCEDCTDFVFEYCAIHGPLLVIPDDKVPSNPDIPSKVPHAALTIPHVFLHLASSSIPGAGIGVFSTLTLPRGVRFGPYRGQRTNAVDSMYCWQIHANNKKIDHVIDAIDPDHSNWMRYVNCARHWTEQNLVAYQYKGQLYYRTIKIIPRFTELLVFYGSEFANILGVNLSKYNSPHYYKEVITPRPPNQKNQAGEIEENFSTEHTDLSTSESNEELLNFNDFHIIDENTQDNELFQNTHVIQTVKVLKNTSLDIAENTHTIDVLKSSPVNIFNKNENNFCNLAAKLNLDTIQPNHKSTQTDEIILGNQKVRIAKKNQEKKFHCENCEKSFTKNKYLKLHDLRLHQTPKYRCEKCKFGTSILFEFKRHCLLHTKQNTFYCSECSYKSMIKYNIDRHIRRHRNDSLLKICSICGYKTLSRWNLYTHKLKHDGIEYKCDYCGYQTNLKPYLVQHIARIHKKNRI